MSSPSGRSISVLAPAKINLFLVVKGRRPDGYHEIETVMQKLVLADRLQLTATDNGIRLLCSDADLPGDEGNLAYRAAMAFFAETGISAGVDIVLEKRIPVAAGLGGGSSDAAAVLTGLDTLFGACLDRAILHRLARGLGADVPFFVARCAAARATGIGDCLTEIDPLPDCRVVLVNPGFPVSTKWVYENLALTRGDNTFMLARDCEALGQDALVIGQKDIPIALFNDLERVTMGQFPFIGRIKEEFSQAGADGVLMSGSGPTVFGLFCGEREETLQRAQSCCKRFSELVDGHVILTDVMA